MNVLGVSAFYHDSASALLRDGKIVAAVQEERFSRKRHDAAFPSQSIRWCLEATGLRVSDLDRVVFYDKPLLKFERILENAVEHAPRGAPAFVAAMKVWLKEKLFTKSAIVKELATIGSMPKRDVPPVLFTEHHEAHAASAFFPGPFGRAAVLCIDGVGEWATTSAWRGYGGRLEPLWEIHFPHSLGLLYAAMTDYLGFRVNSGEYKVMGLAPYGEPAYASRILEHLIDLKPDGTFRLDSRYFGYETSLHMTNGRFHDLFGSPPRSPNDPLTKRHADLARSIQDVAEEVVLRLARTLRRETGEKNLCMAGGVALNCTANTKVRNAGIFDKVWIQPAAGDAGGAIGAAYVGWLDQGETVRTPDGERDAMSAALLGPSFAPPEVRVRLDRLGARYRGHPEPELLRLAGGVLAEGQVLGWFQGAMEFGPRALGGRSILADPRSFAAREKVNRAIKAREAFRPLAASVVVEEAERLFGTQEESPYMLFLGRQAGTSSGEAPLWAIEDWLGASLRPPDCPLPAVIHTDGSTRLQTVRESDHPRYYRLLRAFEALTGVPALLNTSFNVRGEPIVCTPEEAYACFMTTEIDCLVIGDFLLRKEEQPDWTGPRRVFEAD